MKYRRGGIRIWGRHRFWISVAWNMWWIGIRASVYRRPVFTLDLGYVVNDLSKVKR